MTNIRAWWHPHMHTLLIPAQGKWKQADPEISLVRQPNQLGEFQSNDTLVQNKKFMAPTENYKKYKIGL